MRHSTLLLLGFLSLALPVMAQKKAAVAKKKPAASHATVTKAHHAALKAEMARHPDFKRMRDWKELEAKRHAGLLETNADTVFTGLRIRSITYSYGNLNIVSELPGYRQITVVGTGNEDDGYYSSISIMLADSNAYNFYENAVGDYYYSIDLDFWHMYDKQPYDVEAGVEEHMRKRMAADRYFVYEGDRVAPQAFLARLLIGLRQLNGRKYLYKGTFKEQTAVLCLEAADTEAGRTAQRQTMLEMAGQPATPFVSCTWQMLPPHKYETATPGSLMLSVPYINR